MYRQTFRLEVVYGHWTDIHFGLTFTLALYFLFLVNRNWSMDRQTFRKVDIQTLRVYEQTDIPVVL